MAGLSACWQKARTDGQRALQEEKGKPVSHQPVGNEGWAWCLCHAGSKDSLALCLCLQTCSLDSLCSGFTAPVGEVLVL